MEDDDFQEVKLTTGALAAILDRIDKLEEEVRELKYDVGRE